MHAFRVILLLVATPVVATPVTGSPFTPVRAFSIGSDAIRSNTSSDWVRLEEERILSHGSYQRHAFQGLENRDVEIIVTSNRFRPVIEIYDAANQLLERAQGSRTVEMKVALPETGRYVVVVKGSRSDDEGSYRLILQGHSIRRATIPNRSSTL